MAQTKQMVGQNIEMSLEGNKLTLTIDLSKQFGISGSGKSHIIASTGGNVSVPGNESVKIGVNVYRPVGR